MIKIRLKLVCPEIFGDMPSGDYSVPDCCSAREALAFCVEKSSADVRRESLDHVIFMLNGKQVSPETIVSDGDSLFALRPVYGG